MKRVLVTGTAGFVGSNFVEYLLEKTDWEIVGLDSLRHMGDSQRVINHPRFLHLTHDLNAPISPVLEYKIGKIDYLINIASESAIDRSIQNPEAVITNNVNLIINVLAYARKHKIEKIIHLSTDEVYGQCYDHSIKEWEKIVPSNPYSASKAAQEAIAISYWRTYNLPIVLMNCQNMFGKRQNVEKFIPKTIKYISEGKLIPIYSNNGVSGARKYVHVHNLCSAIHFVLGLETAMYVGSDKEELPDRYHVGAEAEYDNVSLVKLISKIMGVEAEYDLVEEKQVRPGYDKKYSLDDNKLKMLGWKPEIEFEESIKDLVLWSLGNKEWLQ